MSNRLLIGIDPGLSGAIAALDYDTLDLLDGWVVPSGDGRIIVADLLDRFDAFAPVKVEQAVIEQVASMPRQGVVSTFTFGRAFGTLEGVVQALQWPLGHITPAVWKRKLGLPRDDKDGSRQWARRRWPVTTNNGDLFTTKVRGQAIADAAGIAIAWKEMHA